MSSKTLGGGNNDMREYRKRREKSSEQLDGKKEKIISRGRF